MLLLKQNDLTWLLVPTARFTLWMSNGFVVFLLDFCCLIPRSPLMPCMRCAPADKTPARTSWQQAQIVVFACGTWPSLNILRWWQERPQITWTMLCCNTSMNVLCLHSRVNLRSVNLVLTFKTLACDHLNRSFWAVRLCRTDYFATQGGLNFYVCRRNSCVWPFKWELLSGTFMWYCSVYYAVQEG